jgi:hypothetical protein
MKERKLKNVLFISYFEKIFEYLVCGVTKKTIGKSNYILKILQMSRYWIRLSIGGIHLSISYSVLTRRNEMNSDRIPNILGWKTIRLILEIFVQ